MSIEGGSEALLDLGEGPFCGDQVKEARSLNIFLLSTKHVIQCY